MYKNVHSNEIWEFHLCLGCRKPQEETAPTLSSEKMDNLPNNFFWACQKVEVSKQPNKHIPKWLVSLRRDETELFHFLAEHKRKKKWPPYKMVRCNQLEFYEILKGKNRWQSIWNKKKFLTQEELTLIYKLTSVEISRYLWRTLEIGWGTERVPPLPPLGGAVCN